MLASWIEDLNMLILRLLKFALVLIIINVHFFPAKASAHIHCKSTQLILQQLDKLQNRKHEIELNIRWLLRQKEDCDRDLEILRGELDQIRKILSEKC